MRYLFPKLRITSYTKLKDDISIDYQLIFIEKEDDHFKLIFQIGNSYAVGYEKGRMKIIDKQTFTSLSSAMTAYNTIIASFYNEFHSIELGNSDYWAEWVDDDDGMNIETLNFVLNKIKKQDPNSNDN